MAECCQPLVSALSFMVIEFLNFSKCLMTHQLEAYAVGIRDSGNYSVKLEGMVCEIHYHNYQLEM